MRQDPLCGHPQFGGAACAQLAVAVFDLELHGVCACRLIGDGGNVTDDAVDGLSGGELCLRRLPCLHVTGIELGDVRGHNDPAVIHESCHRVARLDEITHFDVAFLQRPVKRCAYRHVFQIELCPFEFGLC